MYRLTLSILLAICCCILLGSLVYPKMTRIEVTGNHHYSEADILNLANLKVGAPLLWVTTKSVAGLVADPWIKSVRVIRRWPHTLYLDVREQRPILIKGRTAYAIDGTVLSNAIPADRGSAVTLSGWGKDRSQEAVRIFRLVERAVPQMISYSPNGFTIKFADFSLYTPSAALLQKQGTAVLDQQASLVAVYPWGVSIQP